MSRKEYGEGLGDRTNCGFDLIEERARLLRVPVEATPDGKGLTRTTEQAIYEDRRYQIEYGHSMTLPDGGYWGGSDKVLLSFRLPPHAQARMDLRCVPLKEVKSAFLREMRRLEKAWHDRDYASYRESVNKFLSKRDESKIALRGGGYIALAVESDPSEVSMIFFHGDKSKKCRSPKKIDSMKVVVKTVFAPNRTKLTRRESEQEDCIEVLEDKGFRVLKKASTGDLSVRVMHRSHWLPYLTIRKESLMKMYLDDRSAEKYLSDHVEEQGLLLDLDFGSYKKVLEETPSQTAENMGFELSEALKEWVFDHLIRARGKDYARNSNDLFQKGIEIETQGVSYTLKPVKKDFYGSYFNYDLKGMKGAGADNLFSTAEKVRSGGSTLIAYLKVDKVAISEERKSEYHQAMNEKCINLLKDEYTIIDPQGQRVARKNMARRIARVHLRKNDWVEAPNRAFDDEQEENLWVLYDIAYGSIGKHIRSKDEMIAKYSLFEVIDHDDDPDIDLFIAMKDTKWGKKISVMGHDGTKKSKKAVVMKMLKLLNQRGYYIEASDAVEVLLRRGGFDNIKDERVVMEIVGGKEGVILEGDGYYSRDLGSIGRHTKALFGNPIV